MNTSSEKTGTGQVRSAVETCQLGTDAIVTNSLNEVVVVIGHKS